MLLLRHSTTTTIKLGPALDKTDGVTEETALSPTVNLSKNGGAIAPRNSATAITHDANGWYEVELDTTDTDTLGRLQAYFRDPATHLPVWAEFSVLPAQVYDSLVLATDKLQVDVVEGSAAVSEPSAGAPQATPTITQLLAWLYAVSVNKLTSSSSLQTLHNSAGTSIAKSTLTETGTLFTRDRLQAP